MRDTFKESYLRSVNIFNRLWKLQEITWGRLTGSEKEDDKSWTYARMSTEPPGVGRALHSVWGFRKVNLPVMGHRNSSTNEAGLQVAPQKGLPCRSGAFPELSPAGMLGQEGRWSGGQGGFSAGLCSEILVSCWPIKRQLIFSLVKCPWKQILFPPNQFPLLAYANGTLNESRVCFLHSRVRTFKWDPGGELSFLCLHEQHGSQGANNSVKFHCQNSKEGKLTGGAGNLCFASCCLPDSSV